MKACAFIGSPRKKGNSAVLAEMFLKGAQDAGAEIKQFFLIDCDIKPCRGCFRNCMLVPGTRCAVHRDDMDMLLEEMLSADLNLFVSPLYCATYTAVMAAFFERCLPLWETEIVGEMGTMDAIRFINNPAKGKRAVVAMVQDLKEPSIAQTAFDVFEKNVSRTFMMEIVEKIHVTDVRDVGDIMKKTEKLKEIYEIGKSLIEK